MTLPEITSIAPATTSVGGDDFDGAAMDQDLPDRSACRPSAAEDRIVRDVYGCDAGRSCADATLEQRLCFEQQIAERIAALSTHTEERA